ncbi:MAG: hypothetical protein ABIU95_14185 [Burkholderiales bacterium]
MTIAAADLPRHRAGTAARHRLAAKRSRQSRERAIDTLLVLAAFVSVFTTLAIVFILVSESIQFFRHVSIWDFLTDSQWKPLFDDAHFGISVLLSGTLVSSAVALAVAIPLGTIIVASYLSRHGPRNRRDRADHHHRGTDLHRFLAAVAGGRHGNVSQLPIVVGSLRRDADSNL